MASSPTSDTCPAIFVGKDGEVDGARLRRFDPTTDFIIRENELTIGPCSREIADAIVLLLNKRTDQGWSARSVPIVGYDKPADEKHCWILSVTATDGHGTSDACTKFRKLKELRRCAARKACELAGQPVPVGFHSVLGLTPGHGLIGESVPTRATEDDYFRQRGATGWRLSQAAAVAGRALRGPGKTIGTGAAADRVNIAVIDTGLIPPITVGELPTTLDAAIDVDADDWAPFQVVRSDSTSSLVIAPHVGHATFVTSVLRLCATADIATIHIERATSDERARLHINDTCECSPCSACARRHQTAGADGKFATCTDCIRCQNCTDVGTDAPMWAAGVITEESIAAQLVEVHDSVHLRNADDDHDRLDFVNLSLGSYTYEDRPPIVLEAAIRALTECKRCNTTVVAAAGNYGHDREFWPAAFTGADHHLDVIAVGALACSQERDLSTDQRAPFSNYGPWVDVFAPGTDIVGSYVRGSQRGQRGFPPARFDGYARWSGTSFAAPFVTALLAATLPTGRLRDDEHEPVTTVARLRDWWTSDEGLKLNWIVGVVLPDEDGEPIPRTPPRPTATRKKTARLE